VTLAHAGVTIAVRLVVDAAMIGCESSRPRLRRFISGFGTEAQHDHCDEHRRTESSDYESGAIQTNSNCTAAS
jgi:hypothetical protein